MLALSRQEAETKEKWLRDSRLDKKR